MADSRALTIQNGQVQQIANADALIVGDGILTPSGSGNDLTLTPDGTFVIIGATKTLDAATIDSVGAISIGGTNSTGVTIGRSTVTSTVAGQLTVNELLNARGNVDLGDASTDTISMVGEVDTNIGFVKDTARTVSIAKSSVDVTGAGLTISSGEGGDYSAVVGRIGGLMTVQAGDGGTGAAGIAAGQGGNVVVQAGDGGAQNGGPGGSGGNLTADAGVGTNGTNGVVNIGTTNASAVGIGRAGVTTTVNGALTVVGVLTAQSTTQFQQNATFQGDVTLGNDAGDTVNFGAGSVTATGNPTWNFGTGQADFNGNVDANAGLDVTGSLTTNDATIADSVGLDAYIQLGDGQNAALSPLGTGRIRYNSLTSSIEFSENNNAYAAIGTGTVTGTGTDRRIATWDAAGTGLRDNSDWGIDANGDIRCYAGVIRGIKTNNDRYMLSQSAAAGHSPWFGNVTDNSIVQGNTEIQYTLAGAGTHRFRVSSGTTVAELDGTDMHLGGVDLRVGSSVAATSARIFNADGDTVLGGSAMSGTERLRVVGDARIEGNADITNGADVTGAALTAAAGFTVSGGSIDLDPTGSVTLDMDAGQTITATLPTSQAGALLIQSDIEYFRIDTNQKEVEIGDTSDSIAFIFNGGGTFTIGSGGGGENSVRFLTATSDPTNVANYGQVYVKEVTGISELFYLDDTNQAVQITSNGVVNAGTATNAQQTIITKVANEAIAAGAPVHLYNNAGNPEFREADANDATRDEVIGLATAAITATATGNAAMAGEVSVPDAQWDSIPGIADIGKVVYLSSTVGNLSITAPTPPSTVVRVGWVSDAGGTDGVKVAVNVGTATRTV